jgi:hypothetical protein
MQFRYRQDNSGTADTRHWGRDQTTEDQTVQLRQPRYKLDHLGRTQEQQQLRYKRDNSGTVEARKLRYITDKSGTNQATQVPTEKS